MQSDKEEFRLYSVPDVRTLSRWRDIWMCTSVVLLITTGVFLGLFIWSENKESEFSETTLVYTNVVGTKPATLKYSGQQTLQLDECTSPEHVFTMVVPKDSFNPTSVHRTVVSGEMSVALRHNVLQNALDRQYHMMTPGVTLFVNPNDLSTTSFDDADDALTDVTGSIDNLASATSSAYTAHLYNLTADDTAFTLSLIINEAVSYEPFDRKHAEYKQCDRHFHHDNPSLMQLIGQSTTLQTWALELYRKEQEENNGPPCLTRRRRSDTIYQSFQIDISVSATLRNRVRLQLTPSQGRDLSRCYIPTCILRGFTSADYSKIDGRRVELHLDLGKMNREAPVDTSKWVFQCRSSDMFMQLSLDKRRFIFNCLPRGETVDYNINNLMVQASMATPSPTCNNYLSPPPSPPLPPLVPPPPTSPAPSPPPPPPLPHLPNTTQYIGYCLSGLHASGVRCDCSRLGNGMDMRRLRCGTTSMSYFADCEQSWVNVSSTDSITTFLCNPMFLYNGGCDCDAVSTPPCTIDRIATTDDNRPTDACHGTCMAKKCVWQDQMWPQCVRNGVVTPFTPVTDCNEADSTSCSRSYQSSTVDLRMCIMSLNGVCTTSSYTLQDWCENGRGVDPTF